MKKLLLLAAALILAVACSSEKPGVGPTPDPPKPTGEPFINRTSATVSTLDTLHIFIANADPSEVEWAATDVYMLVPINEDFTQFQALAFGEVTLTGTYDGAEYTCTVKVNKVVEDPQYDMPITDFSLTIDKLKAEAAKTSTFVEEETDKDGITYVIFTQNAPTIAPGGQLNEYAFEDGKMIQSCVVAKYETKTQQDNSWLYTLERCFHWKTDADGFETGPDRATETLFYIFKRLVLKADNTPILMSYFLDYTNESGAPSKAAAKGIVESNYAKKFVSKDTAPHALNLMTL